MPRTGASGRDAGSPRLSFEMFSPRTERAEARLRETVTAPAPLRPPFSSVTCGAGGSTRERTRRSVRRIVERTNVPAAAHLTCAGAARAGIDEVARQYRALGVRHIVALPGDPPEGETRFTPRPDRYDRGASPVGGLHRIADFEISVAGYPETTARAQACKDAGDDYSAILPESLADRLAAAFAEYLHEHVRRELWGYAEAESLDNADLIRERYPGIRPPPGCPEHTEKGLLRDLLEAEARTGTRLTESYAMDPGASVSGFYCAHPDSAYFGLGPIREDQLADYAERKGWDLDTARRWLYSNLDESAGAQPGEPLVRTA